MWNFGCKNKKETNNIRVVHPHPQSNPLCAPELILLSVWHVAFCVPPESFKNRHLHTNTFTHIYSLYYVVESTNFAIFTWPGSQSEMLCFLKKINTMPWRHFLTILYRLFFQHHLSSILQQEVSYHFSKLPTRSLKACIWAGRGGSSL